MQGDISSRQDGKIIEKRKKYLHCFNFLQTRSFDSKKIVVQTFKTWFKNPIFGWVIILKKREKTKKYYCGKFVSISFLNWVFTVQRKGRTKLDALTFSLPQLIDRCNWQIFMWCKFCDLNLPCFLGYLHLCLPVYGLQKSFLKNKLRIVYYKTKVIHPKYYKHLKKAALHSHLGR